MAVAVPIEINFNSETHQATDQVSNIAYCASRFAAAPMWQRAGKFICSEFFAAKIACVLIAFSLVFSSCSMADENSLPSLSPNKHSCDSATTTIDYLQCLNAQWKGLQEKLNKTYQRVLQTTPAYSLFDTRKTRAQLEKSQTAWQNYINENCTYIGGLEGGSNAWVTGFELQCLIKETRARIYFFEHLPTGG